MKLIKSNIICSITQINLIYDNGKMEHYWLPWADVERDDNMYEETLLDYDKGELFIKVNSSKRLHNDYINLMYNMHK